jgi:hypothetical protein
MENYMTDNINRNSFCLNSNISCYATSAAALRECLFAQQAAHDRLCAAGPTASNRNRSPLEISQILLDARWAISSALFFDGYHTALAELAAQSIRLYQLVYCGELVGKFVYRELLQSACNTRLPLIFTRPIVHIALNAGPIFFEMIEAQS